MSFVNGIFHFFAFLSLDFQILKGNFIQPLAFWVSIANSITRDRNVSQIALSLGTYGICIPNGQQMTVTTNQNWNDNIHSYDTLVGEALTSHLKSLILACLTYKTDIYINPEDKKKLKNKCNASKISTQTFLRFSNVTRVVVLSQRHQFVSLQELPKRSPMHGK